ncbi:MAG: HAMP domain-containing protein [Porphyromonadaceae bacterium]|nr:MAG: HAMP domain-containing protein [Porphyromonadaceae bacterium]
MKQPAEIRPRDLLISFRFLFVAVTILLVALIIDPVAHLKEPVKVYPSQIEKDFHRKIRLLENTAHEVLSMVSKYGWPLVLDKDPGFTGRYAKDNDGIAIFILQQDSMLFWSDNSLVVETKDLLQMETGRVYTLPNCSVYTRVYRFDNCKVVGVVFLKKFFPYNNELVSNAFLVGSNIPESYRISIPPVPDAIQVTDDQGRFAFSLIPTEEVTSRKTLHWLTLFLYFVVFVFILFFFSNIMRLAFRLKSSNWWLLALLADLFLVRWLLWYFREPHCVFNLPLFTVFNQPVIFLESRGDVLISIVLLIFFAIWFSRYFKLFPGRGPGPSEKNDKRLVQSMAVAGWLLAIICFLGAIWMIRYLLLQRTGLLEIYRILTINFSNLLDILMLLGILIAFVLLLYRLINRIKSRLTWIQSIIGLVVMSILCFGLARDSGTGQDWVSLMFFLILSVVILSVQNYSRVRFNHGLVTIILVLISAFMVYSIDGVNRTKEAAQHNMILSKLSSEHDQIAEMLLTQIDPDIRADSVLAGLVLDREMKPDDQQMAITNYLKNKYFGLYWNRFEIQAYSCNAASRTVIQPDNSEVGCLDFFVRGMRDRYGKMLPGTAGFYYLDNFDGVIEYLGVYDLFTRDPQNKTSLIINIYSRFVAQALGYPELLITGKIDRDSLDQSYSYAKYHLGNLQLTSGDYDYSLTSDIYPGKIGEVIGFKSDGYNHWIKKIDNNNEIVISRQSNRTGDNLVTFSYVFVFLFLIWLVLNAIMTWPRGFKLPVLGLKQRIQFTMVSFLVFSFMLIGGGMTYYVIQQYKQSNRKLIIEKTESLLADLQNKLGKANALTKEWQDENYRSLNELMIKFSYVFNTDMNIFDPYGNLVVSSRPEVFEYYLAGHKMNPRAYYVMHHQGKPSFIMRESIENLGYYSSYVPLYNQYNKLLGYLNLPYFSRQSETSREISTIVVAMVNAYFILILLTVFLAVVLANQVARPLQLLQSKLAGLRFGRKNQSIEYQRDDEIGRLVKEYNRMVSELQASAEKLARSERESAWREMARQIAHEIKNPLTPMKLSVQHLRKAWKDGAPDLDAYIDRMTTTLIDQIETLSNIANEFSKFAQIPGAHFEPIDLTQKIQRITHLFEDTCKVNLIKNFKGLSEVLIFADPEQVIQVFNNLIRNAIQAVAEGVEPVVDISIEAGEDTVIVKVTDNGIGITDDLQSRLFEPNFTTKSSGMGLGLAITKKIMEGSNGKIWFETRKNAGTSFYLEWPLFKPE